MNRIIVLCTGNSCHSQMAEGYLRYFAGDKAEIFSAGIEAHGLNPRAVESMKEDGIDISGHTSKLIDVFEGVKFDFIITVCDNAHENCPYFLGSEVQFHQNFLDPATVLGTDVEVREAFKEVRVLIREYCEEFAARYL